MKLNPFGLLVMLCLCAGGLIAARGAISEHSASAEPSGAGPSSVAPKLAVKPMVDAAVQGRTAYLRKEDNGHYWANARVNGTSLRLLVDSGASVVALTEADAKRLHIDTSRLLYDREMATAAGRAKGASVILDEIVIDRVRLTQVQAVVMSSGLETSLLGMSFLNRLTSWQATPRAIMIRQ